MILPCSTATLAVLHGSRSLNFFSRSFYLLENVVIFSTKPTVFLSFVLILSSGDCNVYISEQLLYQVKGFVLCRMSTTLALWFAEILTMYTIMLVIRFRTWVLFKVMLSFGIKHVLWDTTVSGVYTGSPSSKYDHRRTSALLRNIRNIKICMGKKPIVSVTYENERISIKNSLTYLKCVLRLSCVVHGPIYGRFMGFYVNGFLSI